jgi:hypothetical protein
MFWAQKQDTVNAALPYVQTIPEQVRREFIQYYFTSIRDEINGGYFEGLKTAINEYQTDEQNNYSNEDRLKISTIIALFIARIWTYCAAIDSIERLTESEGLAATVREECHATLQFALGPVCYVGRRRRCLC